MFWVSVMVNDISLLRPFTFYCINYLLLMFWCKHFTAIIDTNGKHNDAYIRYNAYICNYAYTCICNYRYISTYAYISNYAYISTILPNEIILYDISAQFWANPIMTIHFISVTELVSKRWRVLLSSLHMCTYVVFYAIIAIIAYYIRDGLQLQLVLLVFNVLYIGHYW